MMTAIDLTPFGFTSTENLGYQALLELGPTSGYALAKKINIARANAYHALNGLVSKGGAEIIDEKPLRYRATRPDALFARLLDAESSKLDRLETQIRAGPAGEEEVIQPISGRRALVDLSLRTAAREQGVVTALGPLDLLTALSPAWRRRSADDRVTALWPCDGTGPLPIAAAGTLDPDRLYRHFGTLAFMLRAPKTAIMARVAADSVEGYWSTDQTIAGVVDAAIVALTS